MRPVLWTTVVGVLLATAANVAAAEVVAEVGWDEGAVTAGPPGVELVVRDGSPPRLEVTSDGSSRAVPLARIGSPPVGWPGWRVDGEVQLQRLGGPAFVEMWVAYADGARFFSRSHPWPAGSSGAVPFSLPFRPDPSSPPPVALELQLVLEGAARLDVGPLRVVRAESPDDLMAPAGGWWSERTGAVIGAAAGTGLGLLGALLGVMIARGWALRLAAAGLLAVALAGVAAVAVAVLGLATGQPYAVWYPLGLIGVIAAAVGFAMRPIARRRAQQIELQRMRAADL